MSALLFARAAAECADDLAFFAMTCGAAIKLATVNVAKAAPKYLLFFLIIVFPLMRLLIYKKFAQIQQTYCHGRHNSSKLIPRQALIVFI